ncbi:MAG: hypothetical protein R6W91_07055 [Thermoplasmata archaeon]
MDSQSIMDWHANELERRFGHPTKCSCSWCRSPIGNRQFSHHGVYARYTVRLLRRAKARRNAGIPQPLD